LGTNAPPGNSPHADTPNPVWERATTTVSLPSIYGEREGGEFSTTNFRPSYIIVLLYLFPRSGQGFSFFQDQFLAEGAGFFAKPVLENFSSRVLTFPVPVLCQTNTIRNIRHLEKVGFGRVFCFPWEAFVTLGLRARDAKLSLRQRKPFQNPLFSRYEITSG